MKKSCLAVALVFCMPLFLTKTSYSDLFVIAAGKRAKRTILVSPKSTEAESGAALLAALDGIPEPRPEAEYLIKIEPGVYDLGTNSFNMKEDVDVEGSGEGVTIITGTVDGSATATGVINGADDSELRFLTVKNQRTSGTVMAVCNQSVGSSMKMLYVTAEAGEGSSGLRYAVYNYYSYTAMTNVTALADSSAFNMGIGNVGGAPLIRDSKITAQFGTTCYGMYNYNSTVHVWNTIISASGTTGCGIFNGGSAFSIDVHGSQIYGNTNSVKHGSSAVSRLATSLLYKDNATAGTGGLAHLKCAQCYNGGYDELNSLCQ